MLSINILTLCVCKSFICKICVAIPVTSHCVNRWFHLHPGTVVDVLWSFQSRIRHILLFPLSPGVHWRSEQRLCIYRRVEFRFLYLVFTGGSCCIFSGVVQMWTIHGGERHTKSTERAWITVSCARRLFAPKVYGGLKSHDRKYDTRMITGVHVFMCLGKIRVAYVCIQPLWLILPIDSAVYMAETTINSFFFLVLPSSDFIVVAFSQDVWKRYSLKGQPWQRQHNDRFHRHARPQTVAVGEYISISAAMTGMRLNWR